ncbi:MAG TPA: copper-binding protein [Noviherbaspirillum sp.]|nr:copper-binding protein [Noviherbaspirillum sp.]
MKIGVQSASALVLALAAATAFAVDHSAHMSHGAAAPAVAAAPMSEGEIKKVDRQARKITIKHGPLASVNMPPMTMAFGVSNEALLEGINTGDKIKFVVERKGPALVISRMERVQ